MYLLKKPSSVIGWVLLILFFVDSVTTKFFKEEHSIYLIVFWLGVFVAEKWSSKKEEAERFYSAFYKNGEYVSEKVGKIILYRDTYFQFWIAQKLIFLLSVILGYLIFKQSGQNELLNELFRYTSKNISSLAMPFILFWMGFVGLSVVFFNWILNRAFVALVSKNAESKMRYTEYAEFGNLYFNDKQREEERKLLIKNT